MIVETIVLAIILVIINYVTYIIIRIIDRKERKKLQEQDEIYIKELIEAMNLEAIQEQKTDDQKLELFKALEDDLLNE